MDSEEMTLRVEWADQVASFDCPCGSTDNSIGLDGNDQIECPQCGAVYTAFVDYIVRLYSGGSLVAMG